MINRIAYFSLSRPINSRCFRLDSSPIYLNTVLISLTVALFWSSEKFTIVLDHNRLYFFSLSHVTSPPILLLYILLVMQVQYSLYP